MTIAGAQGRKFHAVIHNAGIGYREPKRVETEGGLPEVFATNLDYRTNLGLSAEFQASSPYRRSDHLAHSLDPAQRLVMEAVQP